MDLNVLTKYVKRDRAGLLERLAQLSLRVSGHVQCCGCRRNARCFLRDPTGRGVCVTECHFLAALSRIAPFHSELIDYKFSYPHNDGRLETQS